MITLVLGGARSGKSELAERAALAGDGPWWYLATGSADGDADMAARIDAHRRRRDGRWTTREVGATLPEALDDVDAGTVLVDALGTWVAAGDDLEVPVDGLVASLERARARGLDVVVVSDEVGLGVHPPTDVGRRFRDVLGAVNRAVADVADEAVLVVAGRVLPLAPSSAWLDDRRVGPVPERSP